MAEPDANNNPDDINVNNNDNINDDYDNPIWSKAIQVSWNEPNTIEVDINLTTTQQKHDHFLDGKFTETIELTGKTWEVDAKYIKINGHGNYIYNVHYKWDGISALWPIEIEAKITLRADYGKHCIYGQRLYHEVDYSNAWTFLKQFEWYSQCKLRDGAIFKLFFDMSIESKCTIGLRTLNWRNFGMSRADTSISNLLLLVKDKLFGNQQAYVSKEYLSICSPVFRSMFCDKSNSEDSIIIEDVTAFTLFLEHLYHSPQPIHDELVDDFLEIACLYRIDYVIKKCEKYLIYHSSLKCEEKLLLADKYSLSRLRAFCADEKCKPDLETWNLPSPDFTVRDQLTNMALIVEGQRLYVNKEYLALLSPVFCAMFFGSFKEQEQSEINISYMNYEEFYDFLEALYPPYKPAKGHTVEHLLRLADMYDVAFIMRECEKFLVRDEEMTPPKISREKKLQYADQYSFPMLRALFLRGVQIDSNGLIYFKYVITSSEKKFRASCIEKGRSTNTLIRPK